jgi:hypothetical protein
MSYRICFTAAAFFAAISAGRAADAPSPTGILGLTEDQVKAKFGEPAPRRAKDEANLQQSLAKRPAEAEFHARESKLREPVVKQVWYGWKKLTAPGTGSLLQPGPVTYKADIRVGFDAKGIARVIEVEGGPKGWDVIVALRNLAGTGWKLDGDMQKVFPPVHNQQILTSNRYIFWSDPGYGTKFGTEGTGPSYVKGITGSGFYRAVAASAEQRAYSICDVPYDSLTSIAVRSAYILDADTFWTWTLADLMNAARNGQEKVAPSPPLKGESGRYKYENLTFEESLTRSGPEAYESQTIERLGAAVVEAIRHPTLDLAQVRLPAEFLRERYDQKLSRQLIALVNSAAELPGTKGRAMEVMARLDDPDMIAPLINQLPGKAGKAALAALERLTEQKLGAEPPAWTAWWKENQAAVRRAYEIRALERSGDVKVVMAGNSKVYHRPECAVLKQLDHFKHPVMKDVRTAGWQPCPKCKPIK